MKRTRDLSPAESLSTHGYAVFDVLTTDAARRDIRTRFQTSLTTFPEYRRDAADPTLTPSGTPVVYVAGGFGGLGNPASFHSDFAREVREAGLAAVLPLLAEYIALPQPGGWSSCRTVPYDAARRKVYVGLDRDTVRPAGTSVTAETFHRDSSPEGTLHNGDEVFGMLLNLNDTTQYFGCVPGTHADLAPWNAVGSFDSITDPGLLAAYKAAATEVPFGPGQAIVFFQHLVHFIWKPARAPTVDRYRVTVSLFLTDDDSPAFDYSKTIADQAVPTIKSGQTPPMYSANVRVHHHSHSHSLHCNTPPARTRSLLSL